MMMFVYMFLKLCPLENDVINARYLNVVVEGYHGYGCLIKRNLCDEKNVVCAAALHRGEIMMQ